MGGFTEAFLVGLHWTGMNKFHVLEMEFKGRYKIVDV